MGIFSSHCTLLTDIHTSEDHGKFAEQRHLKFPGFAFMHLHISQFVMQHEVPHSTTDRTQNPDVSNSLLSPALTFHTNVSYTLFLQAGQFLSTPPGYILCLKPFKLPPAEFV